jgi:hypothetical protein
MESGVPATLVSSGSHRRVEATNVLGRYPATPITGAPWVVVSTPTSGWFQCAGERGSGVALFASIGARKWADEEGVLKPLERVHDFNQFFYAPELEASVEANFSDVPDLEVLPATELRRAYSELGEILHAGYPAAGFVGPHRFFHTPKDTPEVTSPALLAPYGEALRDFALSLERP